MESSEHNWANISETICPEMLVFQNILTNPIISQINTLLLPYLISYYSSAFTINQFHNHNAHNAKVYAPQRLVSTGIMAGKVPIPGYSMYQARLLQHNKHQVIPETHKGLPIRVTCRRFPGSLFQAFREQSAVFGLNRTWRKRGESGARAREPSLSSLSRYFFPR